MVSINVWLCVIIIIQLFYGSPTGIWGPLVSYVASCLPLANFIRTNPLSLLYLRQFEPARYPCLENTRRVIFGRRFSHFRDALLPIGSKGILRAMAVVEVPEIDVAVDGFGIRFNVFDCALV